MRADRLLSLLIILQNRGKTPATQLAKELEVSVHTIYRDIEALSTAGIPVYCERGSQGGCALLDSYRTSLTGLSANELRALFMLSIPVAYQQLGLGPELQAALLKLSAAQTAARSGAKEWMQPRVLVDPAPQKEQPPQPLLHCLHQAAWQDQLAHLTLQLYFGELVQADFAVYGLIYENQQWVVVLQDPRGQFRAVELDRIRNAQVSSASFVRDPDFNLLSFWTNWKEKWARTRPRVAIKLRILPAWTKELPANYGSRFNQLLSQAGDTLPDGSRHLDMSFDHLENARDFVLSLGGAVEVLEPKSLRLMITDFAQQISEVYRANR